MKSKTSSRADKSGEKPKNASFHFELSEAHTYAVSNKTVGYTITEQTLAGLDL